MAHPLMPKATAVWLVENTKLTFDQIADFCGMHKLEIQAVADGEVATGMIGMSPIVSGQLSLEEIARCEADPRTKLKMLRSDLPQPVARSKGPRYTPVTKRADKPDGVAFLVKNHPELLDAQIARLIGTTKDTIEKIRSRAHWNSANIKPRDPVLLGLTKRSDLDAALRKAERRLAREAKAAGKDAPEAIPVSRPMPEDLNLVADEPQVEEDFSPTNPFGNSDAPANDSPANDDMPPATGTGE
ncbi:MAG: cell cycle transcriptional regulator TrcR [Alphaproteobacteria bacterium]